MSDSGKCNNCGEDGHIPAKCPMPDVCKRCRKEGNTHFKDDCPLPRKCYNCQQVGHNSADCPLPNLCRRCRKPGHELAQCPEPAMCFNCRKEGHTTSVCPEPELCRRCKKEGHFVAECTELVICIRCDGEGHMSRECTLEEKTRTVTDEDGKIREIYVPKADKDASELYNSGVTSGINFSKYDEIPVSVTGSKVVDPIQNFKAAEFRQSIYENIIKSGYRTPTPIQKHAIPIIKQGRDMMACAQTGSGKTAAFLLPMINKILDSEGDARTGATTQYPQCLVITPTRELAIQIYHQSRKFSQGTKFMSAVTYGGTSCNYQSMQLMKGCNMLITTPGRLLDFVDRKYISFSNVKCLILDEADRMLDMGFMPDIQKCICSPDMPDKKTRQTLMFSATFPDEIQQVAQEFLNNYLFLTVGVVGGVCTDVEQVFLKVPQFDKREKLEGLLKDKKRDPQERTLVFVQTKRNADFLASFLSGTGLPTTSIHGDRLQREREEALYDFREGTYPILVATAVAARGLDIPGVAHVINYDMPDDVDEYVHRIGRSGRLGNLGKATSFIDLEIDADVVGPLIKMLSSTGTVVPDWLALAGASGGSGDNAAVSVGGDDDEAW